MLYVACTSELELAGRSGGGGCGVVTGSALCASCVNIVEVRLHAFVYI